MTRYRLLLAATLLGSSAAAQAVMVAIEWHAGRFDKTLAIPAGKFVEACETLPRGAQVAWSFEAASPLDFNIHYHEGKQVLFAAKKDQVAKHAGTLTTELEHGYCWMWSNKGAAETTLRFRLSKR